MLRRSLAILLLSVSIAACVGAQSLDEFVQSQMKERHIPAVVYGVFKDGKVVQSGAYGESNVELGVKATTDNVFEIGSVSKQFTATILLKLREEGKLELTDPIGKYVANLPEAWRSIPLTHLLNHTSGIPDIEEIFGYDSYRNIYTPEQIIAVANSRPIEFAPGAKWHYSNTNYVLLGWVLEKLEGKQYEQILKDRITTPLGMKSTRISNPTDIIPNRSSGYMFKDGVLTNRDAMQPSACLGAGTIVSNLEDMAIWDDAITHNRIISAASQQLMWQKTKVAAGEVVYGFGWFIFDFKGHPSVAHSGGTAGFSCDYRRFQDLGFSVMVFSNLYANDVGDIEAMAADKFHPGLTYFSAPKIDDDPAATKRLLAAMGDLAAGKTESPGIAPGMMKQYSDASRAAWKDRLAGLKSATLVDHQKYAVRKEENGESVVETLVYRLEVGGSMILVEFRLTADGRIGLQRRLPY